MRRLRAFLKAVGVVQGRLIMTVFYFVILPPFALIARLTEQRQDRMDGSYWRGREARSAEVRDARMQW